MITEEMLIEILTVAVGGGITEPPRGNLIVKQTCLLFSDNGDEAARHKRGLRATPL